MKQYAYLRRFFLATLFTAGMAVAGTTSAAGLGDALKSGGSDSSSSNGLSKALGGGSAPKGGRSALGLPNLSSDMAGHEIGRAHVCTPVTWPSRMPSPA